MGVPKFFRWISERYPKINQRYGSIPNDDMIREHFGNININNDNGDNVDDRSSSLSSTTSDLVPEYIPLPDLIAMSTIPPIIDNLYIDMNGIIHGCSHSNQYEFQNNGGEENEEEEIMENIEEDDDEDNEIDNENDNNSSTTTMPTTATTISSTEQKKKKKIDRTTANNQSNHPPLPPTTTDNNEEIIIFQNICYYLDRMINEIVKPTTLVYMSIDGVAPRAKLNQQRSRRYRSSNSNDNTNNNVVEQSIYEAHYNQHHHHNIISKQQQQQQQQNESTSSSSSSTVNHNQQQQEQHALWNVAVTTPPPSSVNASLSSTTNNGLEEIEPGRFIGKYETQIQMPSLTPYHESSPTSYHDDITISSGEADGINNDVNNQNNSNVPFHSNTITPGTEFLEKCTKYIEHYIQYKMNNSSNDHNSWKHLTIILSGPNVPGEGEHKIMQYIRDHNTESNNNIRHCIMGQDGDWIMLGLTTHIPNLILLREQVLFDQNKRIKQQNQLWKYATIKSKSSSRNSNTINQQQDNNNDNDNDIIQNIYHKCALDMYIHNTNFEFLHMNILREYLSYEFETSNVVMGKLLKQSDKKQTIRKDIEKEKESLNLVANNNNDDGNIDNINDIDNYDYKYDLEHCINDFVFLTFLVGNDFLPHMPALDIGDNAFDLLFYIYRQQRQLWYQEEINKNNELKINNNNQEQELLPYLTNSGKIISGKRLEEFLQLVGSHEVHYYDYKKRYNDEQQNNPSNNTMMTTKSTSSMNGSSHHDTIMKTMIQSKEEYDRKRYREMMMLSNNNTDNTNGTTHHDTNSLDNIDESIEDIGFKAVMTSTPPPSSPWAEKSHAKTKNNADDDNEEQEQRDLFLRMGDLLQYTITGNSNNKTDNNNNNNNAAINDKTNRSVSSSSTSSSTQSSLQIDDTDLKGRYYSDKFGFSPYDAEKHIALRKAYIEGLVWNLAYYYEGCINWDWYYPYHYGPMISDLINLDQILNEIQFDKNNRGVPLRPFEQLMACMPPTQSHLLPEPYRFLMTDQSKSSIIDFYPTSFVVDMNGKRWPWEAVVLLPFIHTQRLLDATKHIDYETHLSINERERNEVRDAVVYTYNPNISKQLQSIGPGQVFEQMNECHVDSISFKNSSLSLNGSRNMNDKANHGQIDTSYPGIADGHTGTATSIYPKELLPTFSTLRCGLIQNVYRNKLRINVHGSSSRYKALLLEMHNTVPEVFPIETIANQLIGTIIYTNYPHLVEAFVTAVSNSEMIYRGKSTSSNRSLSMDEKNQRRIRLRKIMRNYVMGEKLVGTGGISLVGGEDTLNGLEVLLSVRPFSRFVTLSDGTVIKTFAQKEIDVPLFVTSWAPIQPDPRLVSCPIGLEKDPYHIVKTQTEHENVSAARTPKTKTTPSKTKKAKFTINPFLSLNHKSNEKTLMTATKRKPYVMIDGNHKRSIHTATSIFHSNNIHNQNHDMEYCFNQVEKQQKSWNNDVLWNSSYSLSFYMHRRIEPFCLTNQNLISFDKTIHNGKTLRLQKNNIQQRLFCSSLHVDMNVNRIESPLWMNTTRNNWIRKELPSARLRMTVTLLTVMAFMIGQSEAINGAAIAAASGIMFLRDLCVLCPMLSNNNIMEDDASQSRISPPDFYHGTTTVSFVFNGGIITAVDSRASLGYFVGSKTTQKVLPINSHILGTMAGGAADCSYWIRKLRYEASHHELTECRRISVERSSKILSNALYENRGLGLSVGTMIMGYNDEDNDDSPPKLYYVDSSGLRIEGNVFAVGSGSTFAFGILDTVDLMKLNEQEAIIVGIRAIRHATYRDASSGGYINVYVITRNSGWKLVFSEDLARLI